MGEHLTTKKTPAVTIVAAWIKAETGVGPSIASGSQVCKKIWADLPIAPINKRIQIRFIALTFIPKKTKHRLANKQSEDLIVIEVWYGEILEEEDIIRYEDIYNRQSQW